MLSKLKLKEDRDGRESSAFNLSQSAFLVNLLGDIKATFKTGIFSRLKRDKNITVRSVDVSLGNCKTLISFKDFFVIHTRAPHILSYL